MKYKLTFNLLLVILRKKEGAKPIGIEILTQLNQ